jgi:hypothetical protein
MKKRFSSVLVVLFAIGCGDKGAAPAGPSTTSPASTGAAADNKTKMAASITEEKLAAFAVYQREMIPMMGLTMNVAMGALKIGKSRSDKEDVAAKDEQAKALKAAQEAACKKAGILMSDIPGLTFITAEYYAKRGAAITLQEDIDETRKKIADAKAAGKEPSPVDTAMEERYAEMLEEHPDIRKEYEAKYGKDLVDLLAKHEAEFIEINDLRVRAALKPAK